MKITCKNYEKRYEKALLSLADLGLSRGYLSEGELASLGDSRHFCHIATDESDRLCAINYGRFAELSAACRELRCTAADCKCLFPGVGLFAIDDGCVTLPEARGAGIATELTRYGFDEIFSRAPVLLFFVWNRGGEEKNAVCNILRFGGKFIKSVPRYWYDEPELVCSHCGGRCTCTCDIYCLTKEGLPK